MKQTCDERGAPPWDKGIHRGARVDFLVFGKILRYKLRMTTGVEVGANVDFLVFGKILRLPPQDDNRS
mgnify:CR=1 FL=1